MNKILDKLDQFLASQKESERKLFFFLPILVFGFLSYYFLFPITEQKLDNAIRENKSLENKIKQIKSTNIRLKNENLKINKILVKADKVLKTLNNNKIEMDKLLHKLSFLKFDIEKWAKVFNTIPKIAKDYNLEIIKLDNITNLDKTPQLINKNIDLQIQVNGSFVNFIKFINYFESQKELLKVNYIKIDSNQMQLVIEIYGAKL